jgi:salicylate hydroxylase
VQNVSRDSIRLWHPAGDAAKARNEMLAAMSPSQLHDHVAWMHGARDFAAEPVAEGQGVLR